MYRELKKESGKKKMKKMKIIKKKESLILLAKRVLHNKDGKEIILGNHARKVNHSVNHSTSNKSLNRHNKGVASKSSNKSPSYSPSNANEEGDYCNAAYKNRQFLKKVKSLLANPTEEELQFLYELYEERAAIIEYDGGFCRDMAEKHAMEQIRRLCVAKTEGTDSKGFIPTGMIDKDGLPIKVEASYDITKIEENTEKTPPYLKEKVLAKGIDLDSSQIKDFLEKK